MQYKDYYKILGVSPTDDLPEIKRKYFELAKQLHPDKQLGNEEKFKELTEAFDVLSNDELKKRYDSENSKQYEDGPYQSQEEYAEHAQQAYMRNSTL